MAITNQSYLVTFGSSTKVQTVSLPTGVTVVGYTFDTGAGALQIVTLGDQTATPVTRTVTLLAEGDTQPAGSTVLGVIAWSGNLILTGPFVVCLT
jgi:hypothetical protein